jgi:hypothetical protein
MIIIILRNNVGEESLRGFVPKRKTTSAVEIPVMFRTVLATSMRTRRTGSCDLERFGGRRDVFFKYSNDCV